MNQGKLERTFSYIFAGSAIASLILLKTCDHKTEDTKRQDMRPDTLEAVETISPTR